MSDEKPTPATPDGAGRTQRLPGADATEPLEATEPFHATEALPEATRPLPTARYDDPLSIFDDPRPATGTTDQSSTDQSAPDRSAPDQYASAPPPPAVPAVPADTRGPRSSTVIWGFLVVAFGVGLVASGAGAHLDVELAAIVLLAAAGVLLVIGSAVSVVRRRRRDDVPG